MKNQNSKTGSKLVVEHTPTPWEVLSGEIVKQGYGPNGNIAIIAQAHREPGNGVLPVERDENIKFIVRAVNSHEALMKTLEAVSTFIMNPTDTNKILLSVVGATAIRIIKQAEGE
jgi:hypothetical protein